jgi:hypothetical protein
MVNAMKLVGDLYRHRGLLRPLRRALPRTRAVPPEGSSMPAHRLGATVSSDPSGAG